MPIMSMYIALVTLMIVPVVLYSAATSGVAASTLVLEKGARKEQTDINVTMTSFRCGENRSYTESGTSTKELTKSTGLSGPKDTEVETRSRLGRRDLDCPSWDEWDEEMDMLSELELASTAPLGAAG